MTRVLMEGSEAIAEAMVVAGCRFFAGYPMTPFTEVLEHMARKLPAHGGVCMNAESELEAVGMAWGAAATGTPAATGSVLVWSKLQLIVGVKYGPVSSSVIVLTLQPPKTAFTGRKGLDQRRPWPNGRS